ncbi:MAG TPA: hypothetical protein VN937_11275 [Blastocatellia bacterium]|nr:hypothetical protein [Blastocatellia bacterium]
MESTQTLENRHTLVAAQEHHRTENAAANPRSLFPTLDQSLFVIVTLMLVFTAVLLSVNLIFQHENYSAGISAALKDSVNPNHAIILTYSRAWDFAVVKISSIFLAFCLILIGALYVLRVALASYSLSVEGANAKGALETGSPGLVMLTLGVVLMGIILLSSSNVAYTDPGVPATIAEPKTIQEDPVIAPKEDRQRSTSEKRGAKK